LKFKGLCSPGVPANHAFAPDCQSKVFNERVSPVVMVQIGVNGAGGVYFCWGVLG
jgi:hypothetical protein